MSDNRPEGGYGYRVSDEQLAAYAALTRCSVSRGSTKHDVSCCSY